MEGSDRDKEVESVMIAATPPSRGVKSRKRSREVEGLSSPSTDAISEKSLRETAPMVLARWKTAAYKGSSEPRKLADVEKEMEGSTSSATEEDFKPQKTNTKSKEWISSEHQATGKQVTNDPFEKSKTRNTLGRGGWLWRQ